MVKIANRYIDVIRLKTLTNSLRFIEAQAHLHHQYFLGLQLMVSVEEGREVVGEWMFRFFVKISNFNWPGLGPASERRSAPTGRNGGRPRRCPSPGQLKFEILN